MPHIDVVVGFENTSYTVNEVERQAEVCVAVTDPPLDQLFLAEFVVVPFTLGKEILLAICYYTCSYMYTHAHCRW